MSKANPDGQIEWVVPTELPQRHTPCVECPFRTDTVLTFERTKLRRRQCSLARDNAPLVQTCHMTNLSHVCRGALVFNGAEDTQNNVRVPIPGNVPHVRLTEFFE